MFATRSTYQRSRVEKKVGLWKVASQSEVMDMNRNAHFKFEYWKQYQSGNRPNIPDFLGVGNHNTYVNE